MKNFTRSLSLLALCASTITLSREVASARIKPGFFSPGGTIEVGDTFWKGPFLRINGKTTRDIAVLKALIKSDTDDSLKALKALVRLDAQNKLFDGKKLIVPNEISDLPTYKKYNHKLRRWFSSIDLFEATNLKLKVSYLNALNK